MQLNGSESPTYFCSAAFFARNLTLFRIITLSIELEKGGECTIQAFLIGTEKRPNLHAFYTYVIAMKLDTEVQ